MSDAEKGGFISKVIGPKRRWREYKARVRQLPENYRTTVEAIERYLMHFGPVDGDSAASVFEDVADLFERAAADGTPIREIVPTLRPATLTEPPSTRRPAWAKCAWIS